MQFSQQTTSQIETEETTAAAAAVIALIAREKHRFMTLMWQVSSRPFGQQTATLMLNAEINENKRIEHRASSAQKKERTAQHSS